MKNIFTTILAIVLFLVAFTNAQAQCPLTLEELIDLTQKEGKQLDKFIEAKGYVIYDSISNEKMKTCACKEFVSNKAIAKLNRGVDPW